MKTHASPPLGKRTWTKGEEEYLSENWGTRPIPAIAQDLNRTPNAIIVRARRLGLGAFLDSGDYITLNQLLKTIGSGGGYGYKMQSWVKNRGLPIHTRRVNNCTWRVICLKEFWAWAEKNRAFIDFSKIEPLSLGKEPRWVPEQRKKDFAAFAVQKKDPWTSAEDSRLVMLLKQHRYGYAELSEMLHRSAGAIQRRCADLGVKERPVRADTYGNEWTAEDYRLLADGIRNGDSYTLIGNAIGKSEKAVRGKIYYQYLTESADKVRAMLGSGEWGDGAPTPTVAQGTHLSRTRQQVKKDLSRLDTLLRYRRNQLGFDPYWQRFMCANWDDVGGCTANCSDCDSCTEFRRIRPQYCVRCGGTFYERKENRFCPNCRIARRRQYQRKWAVLNGKGKRV